MNEKLLKQKAEEYANKVHTHVILNWEEVKQAYIAGATEETKLLSEHIRELQNDKGRMSDENKEAKEIVKEYVRLSLQEDKDMIANIELIRKAEQFLGDEK